MVAEYRIISRNGTNPLSAAVSISIEEGYIPIGGIAVHTETRGRERIATYHQAMYKPE